MQNDIAFRVSRFMPATDNHGRPCRIALCTIQFPDGTGTSLAIPEDLIKTIPPELRDDFINAEVAAAVGYQATRQ